MRRKAFTLLLLLGLALMGIGYCLDEYYKANLADKNGDGVKDWKDVDINGDGRVDIRDITLIAKNYNKPVTDDYTWRCDLNGDGFIDDYDLQLAKQFFGEGLSILNIYTNQGKVFMAGLAITVLSLLGLILKRED